MIHGIKSRILSGMQPTGKLHIGNYLGALKNFGELQNSGNYECFFMIADYHSITEDYNPKEKRQQILDLALDYLAAGLDPEKSTIFLQSLVPEHTELAWIFNTITPVAELTRMTQYKDKAARQVKNINAGLFTYPTLMAADILLYKPACIPVGHDQLQHLEITNDIARKFNNKFSFAFQQIKPLLTKFPRVMSLTEPTKKMSKSEPVGCIFIDDQPAAIAEKLKKAVTDTAPKSTEKSPGVHNLFMLLEEFGTSENLKTFNRAYEDKSIRYSELKETLALRIADHFADFRKRRKELEQQPDFIRNVLIEGSKKAQAVARATLDEVKEKIGLKI